MYYIDERFNTKQRHQELNCKLYELNCQLYEHTPAVSLPSQPQFGYLPLYIVSAVGLRQYTIS